MKKLIVLLCLLSCPVMAGDLEDYQAKKKQIKQQINQLQIALIQVNAIISYIAEKEKEVKDGE